MIQQLLVGGNLIHLDNRAIIKSLDKEFMEICNIFYI